MRLRRKPWIGEAMQELLGSYLLTEAQALPAYKGHWQELFPGRPLALEIGCGKGQFINGMAELHPEKAFLGLELQRDVAYYAARKAADAERPNCKIICANAANLEAWFAPGEIRELYLNFSDPWPKARHARRRLTYRSFLALYGRLLGPGGHLHFKTDNRALFDFSLDEFAACGLTVETVCYDLHGSDLPNEVWTEYETKFSAKGTPINFAEVVF